MLLHANDKFNKNMGFIKYFLLFLFYSLGNATATTTDINDLVPGKLHKSVAHLGYERLSIYCYHGVPKRVTDFWQTVQLQVIIDGSSWESYIGYTSNDVLQEYENHRSFWSFNFPFSPKRNVFNLNPFNGTCIGIQTTLDHAAFLHVIRFDYWRLASFLTGLVLFFAAARLSSNPIFHYTSGIALGVSTSFLILIYFTSKLLPTKPAVYGFLAGGWAISLYVLQLLINNIKTIALVYQNYVLGYFGGVAVISFGICYRYGPVKNSRTLALIRWALQIFGLFAIYMSSEFTEAVTVVLVALLVYHNFPTTVFSWMYSTWCARFPPKCKPLTEDEYNELGVKQTKEALEELRKFCSSPECKQWKTVLTLKKPLRFAEFVEGQSHLSETEMSDYESELSKFGFVTDDDSD